MTRRASEGLGERLAHYRRAAGLSAAQLAERTEGAISRSVVANIESGRRADVTVEQLLALAWVLEIPPVALVFPLDAPFSTVDLPGEEGGVPVVPAMWWFNGLKSQRERRHPSPAVTVARTMIRVADRLAVADAFLRLRTREQVDTEVIAEARKELEAAKEEALELGFSLPDDL